MFTVVKINAERITDWDSFHDTFAEALGFPDFYGRNMNAWIDCMTSLDEPEDGLTGVHAPEGGVVVIWIANVDQLASKSPEIYDALVECSAFVNYRKLEVGESPVLTLAFFKNAPAGTTNLDAASRRP